MRFIGECLVSSGEARLPDDVRADEERADRRNRTADFWIDADVARVDVRFLRGAIDANALPAEGAGEPPVDRVSGRDVANAPERTVGVESRPGVQAVDPARRWRRV